MPNEYYIDTRTKALVRILQTLSDKTVMVVRVKDNRRYIAPLDKLEKKAAIYFDRKE